MKKKIYCAAMLAFALVTPHFVQAQLEDGRDPYTLSLEELMNIPINSASKKDETLFDAPLSSYTITRADILQAGSTSIMEALRLAPGVIVREQTNGNYDIHIRGFDNILRTNGASEKNSLSTLVMIDNRPVFNHNLGGTAWEILPVDINDVERIEIVRGPSAPLFGPNAVTGVINIITRKVTEEHQAYASVQYGTGNTMIGQANLGKKVNDKLSVSASFNFANRERFQTEYYNAVTNSYSDVSGMPAVSKRYPHRDRAMQKWGANAFVNYKAAEKITFDLSLGLQESDVQKVLVGSMDMPLTTNITESMYANLAASIHGLAVRASYVDGTDQLDVGAVPNGNDYRNFDVVAEYPINIRKTLTITPGIAHQDTYLSDEKYIVEGDKTTGYLNGSQTIGTSAAYVRTDINLTKKWRLIAGLRGDYFSSSENTTIAYEFASTYMLSDAHLIRAAVTRSNTGAFIGQSFANYEMNLFPGYNLQVSGDPEYKPFTVRMIELGYRTKLHKSVHVDLDLFHQTGDNFGSYMVTQFAPTPPFPAGVPSRIEYQNIPAEAVQIGASMSLNIVPNERFHFKPFFTIQRSEISDLPEGHVSPEAMPNLTYVSGKSTNTPSVYGGYFAAYKLNRKWFFNLNGYFYADHAQYDKSDPNAEGQYAQIGSKVLVNLKVNYSPLKNVNVFFNGRNMLNDESREFYGTDKTGATYLVGASYSLN
jgi:iron complex outermembrane recepter protein